MNYQKLFGKVLQELRTHKGLSQEELADSCGLHRTYISLMERGLRNPSLNTIFSIAEALSTPASTIVRFVETRSKSTSR
jgi:transcriptional regulator with XRE-family HTH domain